jgi:tetratricopeptide (TPR) repeat protein/HEAT repeat protein
VQLLQAQGEVAKAVTEYERLIEDAPHNADFVFQLVDALLQQGKRDKALGYLRRIESSSASDPEAQAALVDFYERIGERDKALALLERVSQNGSDPERLIDLGNHYFEAGDKERAERTWKRVLQLGKDRARAYQRLSDVYLEHDMADSALSAIKSAVELAPDQMTYKKAYALALERSGAAQAGSLRAGQYEEAVRIWQDLLEHAGSGDPLAREARQHIVTLWSLSGELKRHIKPLERRLALTPPDLEAGRLLAEAQLRLRNYSDAERALRRIVTEAPFDTFGLLGLERVLVAQKKLEEALGVLEKLVEIEPKRAREYTQRMAGYAAELYQDRRALELATRVVELSPDDADGHRRLAEMYRRRQEPDKAISELRQALSKNDRLFPVYFDLAELLLNRNDVEQADLLLRRVIRSAPDEDAVSRAVRLSIQINLGRGDLAPLEKELLPLALGNPNRPVYRRLLVELYGALTLPLLQKLASSTGEERDGAHAELERIGKRAVKPLLDALSDDQGNQQQIAIELLSKLPSQAAAPALFAYATGSADPESRARAMIAAGSLDDSSLIPMLEQLLLSKGVVDVDDGDPVRIAAVWALGHMRHPKTTHALLELTHSRSETVRGLSVLGLGFSGAHSSLGRLLELCLDPKQGALVRSASAFAIAELGGKPYGPKLVPLLELSDPSLRSVVLIALARLDAPTIAEKISEELLSSEPDRARAAQSAALILVNGEQRKTAITFSSPDGRFDLARMLEEAVDDSYSADQHANAFIALEKPLTRAIVAALLSSEERALGVIETLPKQNGKLGFDGLTSQLEQASPEVRQHVEQVAERLATSAVGPLLELSSHPSPSIRASVVAFLGTREEPLARKAVLAALDDPNAEVRQAALHHIADWNDENGALAILARARLERDWPLRARTLAILGELSGLAPGSQARARVVEALVRSAKSDAVALVRQAALLALNKLDRATARAVLAEVARADGEAKLRAVAQALLNEGR